MKAGDDGNTRLRVLAAAGALALAGAVSVTQGQGGAAPPKVATRRVTPSNGLSLWAAAGSAAVSAKAPTVALTIKR